MGGEELGLRKRSIGISGFEPASAPAPSVPAWQGRSIGTTKLRLVEFSAFLEQQRDPDSVSVLRVGCLDPGLCSSCPALGSDRSDTLCESRPE